MESGSQIPEISKELESSKTLRVSATSKEKRTQDRLGFKEGHIISDRYRVIDTLGMGAMGIVLRVADLALEDETIALKILFPHYVDDETVFRRFRNEVLIARQLSHPSVVRIYDFGNAGNGYYFLSMEYVAGISLDKRIYDKQFGPLSLNQIVKSLYQISRGVGYAHSQGVIHRDLKPGNVLLTESGDSKLTDFGLARSIVVDKGLTAAGEAVGTPYYMSPEQIQGKGVDHRSDIYSIGIMAYEMAVGERPFVHDSWFELAKLHFGEPIPEFAKKHGLPIWFENFVRKCCEKDADDRFQTIDEAVEVLVENMDDEVKRQCRIPLGIKRNSAKKGRTKSSINFPKKFLSKKILFRSAAVGVATVAGGWVASNFNDTVHSNLATSFLRSEAKGANHNLAKAFIGTDLVYSEEVLVKNAKEGNSLAVEILLDSGLSVDSIEMLTGKSLLHLGVASGSHEMVDLLIKKGADLEQIDNLGSTAVLEAIKTHNNYAFKKLLDAGASVNHQDNFGYTPLMYSAETGETRIIEPLLANGALVNMRNSSGRTAAFFAVKSGNSAALEFLIQNGADVNAVDNDGVSLLEFAKKREPTTLKMAKIIERTL